MTPLLADEFLDFVLRLSPLGQATAIIAVAAVLITFIYCLYHQ
jgi:hypothetical protein